MVVPEVVVTAEMPAPAAKPAQVAMVAWAATVELGDRTVDACLADLGRPPVREAPADSAGGMVDRRYGFDRRYEGDRRHGEHRRQLERRRRGILRQRRRLAAATWSGPGP